MPQVKFPTPEEIFGELFYAIHKNHLFEDGKTIADARALIDPALIMKRYDEQKNASDFDLQKFVDTYFEYRKADSTPVAEETQEEARKPIQQHLHDLWRELKRPAEKGDRRSSKLPLPYPYIVPGGRFDEIYYWDSYFTMLGLAVSEDWATIENMVDNFAYAIEHYGHIPNGNRSYFLSRSQPPFFSLMVRLLIDQKGGVAISKYLPALVEEYNFWMHGLDALEDTEGAQDRVVKLEGTSILNRYYDAKNTPREEMYRDDWELISFADYRAHELFRHLRAACESGWDFSSRWFADPQDITTAVTTDIIQVDLNCLLYHLEKLIAECLEATGEETKAIQYTILAQNRKVSIMKYFWDEKRQFYFDYNFRSGKHTNIWSLAAMYPLYFGLATQAQADAVAAVIERDFLQPGGVVTTTIQTGQQWDSPNGWAPLQWITVKGLMRYGHKVLAQEIALRWTQLNARVYQETGKMMEKYNVVDIHLKSGGGEYPVQDGFGWTNGVYLAMTHDQ